MKATLRELLETATLAVFVFLLLQTTIQNFRVEGSSMQPTLQNGQLLLVNKAVYDRIDLERTSQFLHLPRSLGERLVYLFHPPRRGEIIVFRFPLDESRNFVKRVIAVPGDSVEIRGGRVYVNGKRLEEPYVKAPSFSEEESMTLGTDQYFVMGDNRIASNDSREWGPVPLKDIIGRAWIVYWPPHQLGLMTAPAGEPE
ncbi:MAG: signal peptidase I [Chloroflexi bacterium]|nr:signal peptidase I [Chloroflexota bacterium]